MIRLTLIFGGYIALALGIVGIMIPILPTTPFLIISATCFSATNEKLYQKLINNKVFGEYIRNYKEKTGVRMTVKVRTLIALYLTLSISALLVQKLLVTIILILVAVCVTIHIVMMKTKK